MSFSEQIYRFLIRAYARDHRSRYSDPMMQLFRDRLREVGGFPERVAFWGRTLADWVVSVPASYWTASTPVSSFHSFGDPARRCIFYARCEASSFSENEVSLNHLLLGILRQQAALVPKAALETMVRAIEAEALHGRSLPLVLNPHAHGLRRPSTIGPGEVELGEEAARVVAAATGIAQTAGRPEVMPVDLAAALMEEADSLAARLLREHLPRRD